MYDTLTIHAGSPLIEDRVTYAAPPGKSGGNGSDYGALSFAYWQLGLSDLWGDQYVSKESALTYSAVWACVRVISESLSGIGWHAFERRPDNPRFKFDVVDDIAWLLGLQANPETSAFDWRQVMLKDALTWGNGYSEIERLNNGKPLWLWQIHPSRVKVIRDADEQLVYEIDNGPGVPKTPLRPENVFHLKGISPDGIVGWSIIELARKSIKLGLEEEAFGSNYFGRGVMPGGIVTIPGNVNTEARREYQEDFQKLYGGRSNQFRVMALSNGMTFTPMSLPNSDGQFLESRTFQVQEVCRWFGVPPHKLADLVRATFSNIEEQERAFVTDCLLPWARRLESEADIKLFGGKQRGRRFTRLNLDSLQRGNSTTQTTTVTQKVAGGLMTPDEGREYFDLNPYPDGLGEEPIVQGAMVPLERVLEEPAPEPSLAAAPAEPAQNGKPPADIAALFAGLLTNEYNRLLRVDADKAQRAHKRGKLSDHLGSLHSAEKSREEMVKALQPFFIAFAKATGKPIPAKDKIERRARMYDAFVKDIIERNGPDGLNSADCSELAQCDLAYLWNGAT